VRDGRVAGRVGDGLGIADFQRHATGRNAPSHIPFGLFLSAAQARVGGGVSGAGLTGCRAHVDTQNRSRAC
jgi:hypothetical protein